MFTLSNLIIGNEIKLKNDKQSVIYNGITTIGDNNYIHIEKDGISHWINILDNQIKDKSKSIDFNYTNFVKLMHITFNREFTVCSKIKNSVYSMYKKNNLSNELYFNICVFIVANNFNINIINCSIKNLLDQINLSDYRIISDIIINVAKLLYNISKKELNKLGSCIQIPVYFKIKI